MWIILTTVEVQDWPEVHNGDPVWCSLYSIHSRRLRVDTLWKTLLFPAVQMQDNESQTWKKAKSIRTELQLWVFYCQGDAFNEHSLSPCIQSFTASCIQQWLPFLLLVAAWQLTSDTSCSSWSLFNKLGPPISSQPSGLTHRLPAPLGWPWCHLHVGVPKAQITEYIYQRPRPTLPHLFNRPGCPLVRAGFLFSL